jgi:hypothetical protein
VNPVTDAGAAAQAAKATIINIADTVRTAIEPPNADDVRPERDYFDTIYTKIPSSTLSRLFLALDGGEAGD